MHTAQRDSLPRVDGAASQGNEGRVNCGDVVYYTGKGDTLGALSWLHVVERRGRLRYLICFLGVRAWHDALNVQLARFILPIQSDYAVLNFGR